MANHKINHKDIIEAIKTLRAGGVIVHATETCYGFACDVFNKGALRRLYDLKQMDLNKPVSIFVSDLKTARRFGFFSKKALELARKHWPGPLTIIVKRKKILPTFLNPKSKTVGIRIPGHGLSLELATKFGGPLTTTSANISGLPSPYSISEIERQFKKAAPYPDFIVNSGHISQNLPSTVVNCSGKRIKILRQGEIVI